MNAPDKPGYYWVRFKGIQEWTVAEYENPTYRDGTTNPLPVQVVGSDELFRVDEFDSWIPIERPQQEQP